MIRAIRETWELIKEFDADRKGDWIFAGLTVLGWFGVWIWMALLTPPSL